MLVSKNVIATTIRLVMFVFAMFGMQGIISHFFPEWLSINIPLIYSLALVGIAFFGTALVEILRRY